MASKIEIANMALQKVGAAIITSTILDADSTDSAQKINVAYNITLDEVLAAGSWSAATYEAELTQDQFKPLFDYAHQYHLPTDPFCLKVTRMEGATGNRAVEYKIQNRLLLTDESRVKIKYIARLRDAEILGVYLTTAFILKLAVAVCIPITKSKSLYETFRDEYEKVVLPQCIIQDNQQGTNPAYSYSSDIDGARSDA